MGDYEVSLSVHQFYQIAHSGGGWKQWGGWAEGGSKWEISTLSTQFYSKPETALKKNKVLLKKIKCLKPNDLSSHMQQTRKTERKGPQKHA